MTENSRSAIDGSLHSDGGRGVVRLSARFSTNVEDLWSSITDPKRVGQWYGTVSGDLRVGGEFTAVVFASGWDGHGRIDDCDPQRRLAVTMWEEVGAEHRVAAVLVADDDETVLELEVRGLPLEFVWAYGAGWQVHLEDLGAHLAGQEGRNPPTRWDELEPIYRAKSVEPLGTS
jgi:uncharacterized protein YndB with AHSA1/START domain